VDVDPGGRGGGGGGGGAGKGVLMGRFESYNDVRILQQPVEIKQIPPP
jgi:hypothetical protein